MTKRLALTLAFLALTVQAVLIAGALLFPPDHAVSTLPACTTEDDVRDCYWDANRRGNQTGTSFVHYQGNYYLLDD